MAGVEVTVDPQSEAEFGESLLAAFEGSLLVEALAAWAFARWSELAYQRLTKTRAAYLAAMQPPRILSEESAVLELSPMVPEIEEGWPGGDMRQTLLKGQASRVVAFAHDREGPTGAPLGYAFRASMGAAGAKALGRQVAKQARRGGQGAAVKLKPEHKRDLYAGAQKRAQGSGYLVFRTISANAPQGSWMFPSVEGRNLLGQVSDDVDQAADSVIEGVLEAVLGGK